MKTIQRENDSTAYGRGGRTGCVELDVHEHGVPHARGHVGIIPPVLPVHTLLVGGADIHVRHQPPCRHRHAHELS